MFNLASTVVTIGAVTKPLDAALSKVRGELGQLASKPVDVKINEGGGILGDLKGIVGGIFSEITGIFGALGRMLQTVVVGGLASATAGMSALAGASFYAAKQAATLSMEMHRNKEIFGTMFPIVNKTIEGLAKSFGYTRTELAGMSADLGLMFVGMGLNSQATAKLSSQFLKLGVDASMLYGMDLPEFWGRLEGGIAGANRGLRKMGIFIDDNKVQWEKWSLAAQGMTWVTEEQGDQLARTSLIMKGLAKATGQAKWAHQQFGGTLRETQGRISEMWVTFGEAVKPAWTRIIMKVNELLKQMGEWLERNKALIKSWADYIASILIFVLDNWKEILGAIGEVAKNAWNGIVAGVAAIPKAFMGALGGIGGFFMDKFKAIGEIVSAEFSYAFGIVKTILSNFKDNAISIFTMLWNDVKSGFLSVVSKIVWGLSYLEKPFKSFANVIIKAFEDAYQSIKTIVIPIMDLMVALGKMDKKSADAFKRAPDKLPRLDVDASVLGEMSAEIAKVAAEAAEKARAAPGMKGLLDGAPAFPAVAMAQAMDRLMALPMPNLKGFMDIMREAGIDVIRWMDPLAKIFAKFKALQEAEAKKKQKEEKLGPGMTNPLMPSAGQTTGGFVGITEFAKRIQEGALGKDAYAMATANNTKRMAEMMALWGPALIQNLVNAGFAGP